MTGLDADLAGEAGPVLAADEGFAGGRPAARPARSDAGRARRSFCASVERSGSAGTGAGAGAALVARLSSGALLAGRSLAAGSVARRHLKRRWRRASAVAPWRRCSDLDFRWIRDLRSPVVAFDGASGGAVLLSPCRPRGHACAWAPRRRLGAAGSAVVVSAAEPGSAVRAAGCPPAGRGLAERGWSSRCRGCARWSRQRRSGRRLRSRRPLLACAAGRVGTLRCWVFLAPVCTTIAVARDVPLGPDRAGSDRGWHRKSVIRSGCCRSDGAGAAGPDPPETGISCGTACGRARLASAMRVKHGGNLAAIVCPAISREGGWLTGAVGIRNSTTGRGPRRRRGAVLGGQRNLAEKVDAVLVGGGLTGTAVAKDLHAPWPVSGVMK